MAIRIGKDGIIINGDEIMEKSNGTVIREDGTIESTNIASSQNYNNVRSVRTDLPVSPLENPINNNTHITEPQSEINSEIHVNTGRLTVNAKDIKDKEYDIQVQESRIRNAFPKTAIIVTCVFVVLALLFNTAYLLIPVVIAGIMIFIGFFKKSELEQQKIIMQSELDDMRNGLR